MMMMGGGMSNMSGGMSNMSGGAMGMDNMSGMMNMNGTAMGQMNGAAMGPMNMNGAASGSWNGAAMGPMNMNGVDMTNMAGMANHGTGVHAAANGAFGAVNSAGGLDITALLTGLLNFAIAAFAILLVVGVVVGAIVFLKRYLFDGIVAVAPSKPVCASCGSALQRGWNCCPKCGTSKYNPQPVQPQAQV
jgi:hypothetical protein